MVKKQALVLALVAGSFMLQAAPVLAGDSYRLLETSEEARQRQGAEAWQRYEQRGYRPPLGGYQERLGDPWQPGAERPGYLPDDRDTGLDDTGLDDTGRSDTGLDGNGGWPGFQMRSYEPQ